MFFSAFRNPGGSRSPIQDRPYQTAAVHKRTHHDRDGTWVYTRDITKDHTSGRPTPTARPTPHSFYLVCTQRTRLRCASPSPGMLHVAIESPRACTGESRSRVSALLGTACGSADPAEHAPRALNTGEPPTNDCTQLQPTRSNASRAARGIL